MPKRANSAPALPAAEEEKTEIGHHELMGMLDGYPDKDVLALVEEKGKPDDCGDTLFEFLYHEAHDSAGDPAEFKDMCLRALTEIEAVVEHLDNKFGL